MRAISIVGAEDGLGPPYYHTPDDTPDKLDDEAMTRAVDFTARPGRARSTATSAGSVRARPPPPIRYKRPWSGGR